MRGAKAERWNRARARVERFAINRHICPWCQSTVLEDVLGTALLAVYCGCPGYGISARPPHELVMVQGTSGRRG